MPLLSFQPSDYRSQTGVELQHSPEDDSRAGGCRGQTSLEGEWDDVMGVIKQCLDKMSSDCDRITCSIKIDYRKGKSGRLESKMASVEAKLGKKLNT